MCDYEPPDIQKRDGNTLVALSMCWQTPVRCVTRFYEEIKKMREAYGRNLLFRAVGEHKILDETDGKNILDLLCIVAGIKLEVIVQGEDETAEMIARQLYSGLTSPDCHDFDMHRHDKGSH